MRSGVVASGIVFALFMRSRVAVAVVFAAVIRGGRLLLLVIRPAAVALLQDVVLGAQHVLVV